MFNCILSIRILSIIRKILPTPNVWIAPHISYSSKYHHSCSIEDRKSYGLETTWANFFFQANYPLKMPLQKTSKVILQYFEAYCITHLDPELLSVLWNFKAFHFSGPSPHSYHIYTDSSERTLPRILIHTGHCQATGTQHAVSGLKTVAWSYCLNVLACLFVRVLFPLQDSQSSLLISR